jgi:hypothetical protein
LKDSCVEVLFDALRPLVAEVVAEVLAERELEKEHAREAEYLTTAEYAVRFKSTPGAVLARIHRRTLPAMRPPGARKWLIRVDGSDDDDR